MEFSNETVSWYKMEDDLLRNLFVNHKLNNIIHKRTPDSITNRLVKLKLIEDRVNFIGTEFYELVKNKRSTNKFELMCEIISKHFKEYNKKIYSLEKELNDLKEFYNLKEID